MKNKRNARNVKDMKLPIIAAVIAVTMLMSAGQAQAFLSWNVFDWLQEDCDAQMIRVVEGVLGDSTPEACSQFDLACDVTSQYICYCGSYDLDSCLEYPPTVDQCDYCPGGCFKSGSLAGAQCYTESAMAELCGDAGACIEGDRRCGSTNFQESVEEAVITCRYDPVIGCNTWSTIDVIPCISFDADGNKLSGECVESTGTCQTYAAFESSECTSITQYKCWGDGKAPCKNIGGGIMMFDYNDIWPCQFGCENGNCLLADGEEYTHDCKEGQLRCGTSVENEDYIQRCITNTQTKRMEWKPIVIGIDTHCDHGCLHGWCNPDPETRQSWEDGDDCILDKTRCTANGYEQTCTGNAQGNPVWGKTRQCVSGACRGGTCLNKTQTGIRFEIPIAAFSDDAECQGVNVAGLGFDDNNFWINFALLNTTPNIWTKCARAPSKLLVMEIDGTIRGLFNITATNGQDHGMMSDLAWDGREMWSMNGSHVFTIDRFGNAEERWKIPILYNDAVDSTHFYLEPPFFMAVDGSYVYIGYHNNATYYYDKASGAEQGYICLVSDRLFVGVETASNTCRDWNHSSTSGEFDHTYFDIDRGNDLIYQLYYFFDVGFGIGGFIVPWENNKEGTNFQVYALDGEYRGTNNIQAEHIYNGISKAGSITWLLETTVNQNLNHQNVFIQKVQDFSACQNPCFDGSQKCIGFLNNLYVDCVQGDDGCWDWYSPEKFPELDPDDYTHNCGANTCETHWENHKIRKAKCADGKLCKDICDIGKTECTLDKGYIKHCVLATLPWKDPLNPAAPLVIEECLTWDLKGDWTLCPLGTQCKFGECVEFNQCYPGESKCSNYTFDPDHKSVMYCDDIFKDGFYTWNILNQTRCEFFCNQTSIDTTTNLPCNDTSTHCIRQATCNDKGAMIFTELDDKGKEMALWLDIMFKSPGDKAFFIIIMIIITVIVIGIFAPAIENIAMGAGGWVLIGSASGFLPIYLLAVGSVLAAFSLYRMLAGD